MMEQEYYCNRGRDWKIMMAERGAGFVPEIIPETVGYGMIPI